VHRIVANSSATPCCCSAAYAPVLACPLQLLPGQRGGLVSAGLMGLMRLCCAVWCAVCCVLCCVLCCVGALSTRTD
jgi:hypothetical protein